MNRPVTCENSCGVEVCGVPHRADRGRLRRVFRDGPLCAWHTYRRPDKSVFCWAVYAWEVEP